MRLRADAFIRLEDFRRQLSELIDDLLEEPAADRARWQPAVDLLDHPDHLTVCLELPGVAADEVAVELAGRELAIRGHKGPAAGQPADRHYHLLERFVGPFEVVLELPVAVLPTESRAHLRDGLLTVELTKVRDQRRRRYTIPVDDEELPDHA